ncbi:DUF2314 domain-containing protein [Novipirellula sp. SH528]|uniref:DUF2314 domain-containing protein n=1 Tax=Novipirellula sp. SH528 TaxID=3454466 RepID=UPI003FA12FEF
MAQVYLTADNDPEMRTANERARRTFRFFWRELSWERRRIIPGLDLACVKVPFTDPPELQAAENSEGVEQMWLGDVDFDGQKVSGTLLNSPNWLKSISEGDEAKFPGKALSDWMYVLNGRVYGAFTVQVLRAKMSAKERKQHDDAWGFDFGDPENIHVVPPEWFTDKQSEPSPSPEKSKGGFLGKLLGRSAKQTPASLPPADPKLVSSMEHPMAANMADSLTEYLQQNPENVHATDDRGWTMLHQQALAGTAIGVSILLKHGADPKAVTPNGASALQLAKSLGWKQVVDVLAAHGAT